MNDIHYCYWTENEKEALAHASTDHLDDLRQIGRSVVAHAPYPIEMICGPITTGGVWSTTENLLIFRRIIEIKWAERGPIFFSQMPFETAMIQFNRKWRSRYPKETYCWPILHEFYQPLFSSGRIRQLNFIYGWRHSTGTVWEHNQCRQHGMKVEYLPRELSERVAQELGITMPVRAGQTSICRR